MKSLLEHKELLTEKKVKTDEDGIYIHATIKTKKFGNVTVYKIEDNGRAGFTYYVEDSKGNKHSLGKKAFDGATYTDTGKKVADYAKDKAARLKAEKEAKAKEKAEKKKTAWNTSKYNKWIKSMASNGGAENAFDMAQNAKSNPGLLDYVKKNNPGDDPLQRIQWDIEAYA